MYYMKKIALSVMQSSETSVRQIGENQDMGKSWVAKCLKNNQFHPFHIPFDQNVSGNVFDNRCISFNKILHSSNECFMQYEQFPILIGHLPEQMKWCKIDGASPHCHRPVFEILSIIYFQTIGLIEEN